MTSPPSGMNRAIEPDWPTGTIAKFGRVWPAIATLSVDEAPSVPPNVGIACRKEAV